VTVSDTVKSTTPGNAPSDRLKIFVSYSRRDMEVADRVVAALEWAGFAVTIDRRDLPYGEEWQGELADLIRASDTVIWLASRNSLRSRWCNWELGEVQRLKKRLIPLAIEALPPEGLPETLGRIHMLPAEGVFDLKKHQRALVEALNNDRAWLKEHTRFADRARHWLTRERAPAFLLRGVALKDAQAWADRKPKTAPAPSDEVLQLLLASRRAQGRGQRIAVAALLIIAIAGIGLAGVAYWQRGIAIEQRVLAERSEARAVEQQKLAEDRAVSEQAAKVDAEENFETAKETVNGLVFDIAQGLGDVEGIRIESIKKVLTRVQEAVDRLAKSDVGDIGLQRIRAAMLTNFGDTYLAAGDGAAALSAHKEALGIFRGLISREPENDKWRRDASVSMNKVGDARLRTGDAVGALRSYEDSLALRRTFADENPGDVLATRDVTESLNNVGDMKARAGDLEGALTAFQESQTIRRRLAEAIPGDTQAKLDLALVVQRIADVRQRSGDAAVALSAYQEGLNILRELVEQDAGNTEWQRQLALALQNIAGEKMRSGDSAGALSYYDEALAVARRLTSLDMANVVWRRDLSLVLERIADVHLRGGDARTALEATEESLAIRRVLAERDPQSTDNKVDVSIALEHLGDAKLSRGDNAGALAAYVESLAIRRSVTDAEPGNEEFLRHVSFSLDKVGDVKFGSGDVEGARPDYVESLAIRRHLMERNPGSLDRQRDLTLSLDRIGKVLLALRDTTGALAAFEESLTIARRLAELDSDTEAQRDLALSLDNLGNARHSAGETKTALIAYEEALGLARLLAGLDRGNAQWQVDLIVSLYKVALASEGPRRRRALTEAIEIAERLEKEGRLSVDEQSMSADLRAMLAE